MGITGPENAIISSKLVRAVVTVVMVMVVAVSLPPSCNARHLRHQNHPSRSRDSGSNRQGLRGSQSPSGIPTGPLGSAPVWQRSPCFPTAIPSAASEGTGDNDADVPERRRLDSPISDGQTAVSEFVQFLVHEASWTRQYIEQIITIIRGRTRDSNVIAAYDILDTMSGFPPLDRHMLERNLSQALPVDYERVSRLGIFLEQAMSDTRPYRHHLTSAFDHVTGMLCWLEQASLSLCQPINYGVTRSIMGPELRHLRSSAMRDTRNYVIGRDALLLLNGMVEYYERQVTTSENMAAGNCR